MSVSIIACPSCKSLVLPDTAQCPNCNFVFDEKRASVEPVTAGRVEPTEEEIPCPGCNELVRKGLVRCWNCGTFMQSHIAETYKRMQISPPKVIYSETDPSEQDAGAFSGSVSDSGRLIDDAPPPGAPSDADEDFEMAGGMPEDPDEGDFDLGTAEPPSMPNEIVQSAPVFALKKEEDEEPKASPKAGKGKKADKAAAAEAATAAKKTPDSRPEFSNEFENRFGADDAGGTGEGLLRVALAEEAETGSRKRLQKGAEAPAKSGFRVYCPNGHCIEVQERHRGRTGRCPRCRELYYVPGGSWDEEKALQEDEAKKAAAITAAVEADQNKGAGAQIEISAGEFTRWMLDSHFHSVDLTKLKLKSGSLLKDFQEADVGFAPDGILTVLLTKKGGLLGGGDKKKLAARDAVIHHLSEGKARQELPAAAHYFFPAAQVSQLRVVQPIVSAEQSMFAGVPVFGDGRIAIRLPKQDGTPNPQFLSFSLSEFRRFCKILEEFYALRGLGADSGVPVEDVYSDRMCHFSNQPMRILEHVEFYKDDPGFKLKIIGYKCDGCGLVVSEESREKEQIGGKGAKKIAKAKCPKCKKPFGNLPQYSLDSPGAAS
jgi:hypothetical protein